MMRALLLVAFLASSASADVWKRASDPDPTIDVFNSLMQKGDDAAIAANSESISVTSTLKQIDLAIDSYRAAIKVDRKASEPHFRIASILNAFFFECTDILNRGVPKTCGLTAQFQRRAVDLLNAWDAFEALAPLDPRVNEMLFDRAILRTKLLSFGRATNSEELLRGVVKDYTALLDRKDGFQSGTPEGILGNLAETHMMLGDVEKAIETYREAIKLGGSTSILYGLAVALDRDGQGSLALSIMRTQGPDALHDFRRDFVRGNVFFVPRGEAEYYFALAAEAFNEYGEAIERWKAFITSGAHPQYQPRAKEHLEKLTLRRNLRFDVPLKPDLGRESRPFPFPKTP